MKWNYAELSLINATCDINVALSSVTRYVLKRVNVWSKLFHRRIALLY